MNREKFMQVLEETQEATASEGFADAVRQQLSESKTYCYHPAPAENGYALCGARCGTGFAQALVRLLPNDAIEVVVETGLRVKRENERALRKLLRHYTGQFRLRGLILENGEIQFKTEPIDPINGRFDADKAVRLALSSVYAYAGVSLALDAGVPGWELLEYNNRSVGTSEGDDNEDDDDGTPLEMAEELSSLADLLEIIRENESKNEEQTATSTR